MSQKNQENRIAVYYTSLESPLDATVFNDLIAKLPERMQAVLKRYKRWQNQHEYLLGKLLLLQGLKEVGYAADCLQDIVYNEYGRPYLDQEVDFNISHSGKYIVCAVAKGLKLGIDIEEIKDKDLSDFKVAMTDEQWNEIFESPLPHHKFYQYWSIKESVIKADGKGLSIPLNELFIHDNVVSYGANKWHLYPLKIDRNYCCTLASFKPDCEMTVKESLFN